MARLIYVMDPMCSWCWGFSPVVDVLEKKAQAAGVPLQVVAGGLRPGTREALEPEKRAYFLKHWARVNETTGQPFQFDGAMPDGFIYNTEPPCRALVVARGLDESLTRPMVKRMQRGFYAEGRNITQADVLVELAEEVGLPREEFAKAFNSDAARDATAADFAWAQGLGISGFPTLLVERDGQFALLTNGYQPLNALEPLFTRWLEKSVHA